MIITKRVSVLFGLLITIISSCVNTKNFVYFNDLQKVNAEDSSRNLQEILVQDGDVLQVVVSTIDKDISALFNPISTGSIASNSANQIAQGYLVDNTGNVELPLVGKVYVRGKTTSQINAVIKTNLEKLIKSPFVATRLLTFRVSVLGDVARPGSFNITNERVSLLDALSMAGDLNITATRDDVMLIREVEGRKKFISFNLNDSKTLSSPYFYLTNNDVIYVKPGANRVTSSTMGFQLLPTILGGLSLVVVLLSTILK